MTILNWTVVAAYAFGLVLAISPASAQQNVNCTGTLPAGTYNNVNVPRNASCTLNSSATVQGNVTVAAAASLTTSFAVINGSILSNNAAIVSIGLDGSSTIGMNVTLLGTTGEALVENNMIGGNLQISGSTTSGTVEINDNSVTGNVTFLSNTSGTNVIMNNSIGGNLVCAGNTPSPTGSNLTVGGHNIGQCAGL
jgi:hexosaminidase